ncbi:MAG: hypothetical protein AAGA57_01615 [Planctomycetota bacterium]
MTVRWFFDRTDPAKRAQWALLLAAPPAGLAVALVGFRHAAVAGDRLASAIAGASLVAALAAAAAVVRKAQRPFKQAASLEADA